MYEKNLQNLKEKLKLKIISIYVIDDEKKKEYIDLVNSVNEIDILYEIDQRLNEVMKDLWKLAVKLIEWAGKEVIAQFKAIINNEIIKSIHQKEEEQRKLESEELDELEKNLEMILDKI